MNIEQQIDELVAYIDQPFFVPPGGRDFGWNVPAHEAGHAIVGNVIRQEDHIVRVFVEPDTQTIYGYAATTELEPGKTREGFNASAKGVIPCYPGLERALIKHCAVKLAGLAAECIAAGMGWRYALAQRRVALEGQDAIDCAAYCDLVAGWNFQRIALPAWALAMRILEAKWAEVEAIAASIVPTNPPPHIRQYFKQVAA